MSAVLVVGFLSTAGSEGGGCFKGWCTCVVCTCFDGVLVGGPVVVCELCGVVSKGCRDTCWVRQRRQGRRVHLGGVCAPVAGRAHAVWEKANMHDVQYTRCEVFNSFSLCVY